MFSQETIHAIGAQADKMKVEPAALQAVVAVESNGVATARVNGKDKPLIRWEGHYFYRRLEGEERAEAVRLGLAASKAGVVKNPKDQPARWRIVAAAMKINRQAALESFSIGVGQVMTAHWQWLGFDRVDGLIKMASASVGGQIELMARFIVKAGLDDELRRLDFTAFARGYNGAGFRKNAYHTKMAAEYQRLTGKKAVSNATSMLRMGSTGARVRELQVLLGRAGYAVKVDGEYGTATRDAVKAFQRKHKIAVDGVAGPETVRKLDVLKAAPEEQPGKQSAIETKEAKEGLGGIVGGGTLEVASQKLDEVSDKVSWIPGLEWLSTILTVLAVILVFGGLAWVAWGWIKARRTDEGDVQPVETIADGELDPVLA